MSATVTFAGNLAEAPELHHRRKNKKPFVACRVRVDRPISNDRGKRVNDEPSAQNLKSFGSASTHVQDGCGSGNRIFVRGLERTESWPDQETGEKRATDIVVVDIGFGEVGLSPKYVSARIDRGPHAAQAS